MILAVTGIALAKTLLGSTGVWSDSKQARFDFSSFRLIAKSAQSALLLSVELATVSTLLAALLGILIAYLIHMVDRFGRPLAVVAGLIVITPHIVAAASFNFLLADSGFLARLFRLIQPRWPEFVAGPLWLAVILDFAWKESAFIALVLLASLPRHAKEMQHVAGTLGARPFRIAANVLLPIVKPALIVSSGLAFVYSIGSYEATWVLGRTYPEPLANMTFRLFSNTDVGIRPQAYASAVLSVLLITIATSITVLAMRRKVRS